MNSPLTTQSKPAIHPLFLAAAVAIFLVCIVGVAVMMGWLPSSAAKNSEVPVNATGQPITGQSVPATILPASEPANQRTKPAHHPRPEYVASTGPTMCSECGVIDAVNEIDSRGQGSGVGAAGGAVVGGLLGNQVGGGRGRELATIAGAIGGAVAGNQVEGSVRSTHTYDISVPLERRLYSYLPSI